MNTQPIIAEKIRIKLALQTDVPTFNHTLQQSSFRGLTTESIGSRYMQQPSNSLGSKRRRKFLRCAKPGIPWSSHGTTTLAE